MAKTFDQSLIDTAIIPMSMIDVEDMENTSSEEFISLRRVQQGCHSELSNREDFPFNKYTKNLQLSKGQSSYTLPEGKITQVRINNNNTIEKLNYSSELELFNKKEGKPELYTVKYNPNKIEFYPVPDKIYNVSIDYISTKNIILTDGSLSYTIEIGSTLKMPEQFQHLYFDALEYYVLTTNMRKASNPRWQPTYNIFLEKWKTFVTGTKTVDSNTIFTIF